jgi:hypothetical protein
LNAQNKPKALVLLSGGLDSTLAVKLLLEQGVEVEAINFVSPFCLCNKGGCGAQKVAKNLNVPMKTMQLGKDYLQIVRKPRYGYGKNMNPCIDCRILLFKKAKKYAKEIGASFIATGEVLGQRQMSQHGNTLALIEEKAGLSGMVLRPLSGKLLPPTEVEKFLVKRDTLLGIQGRSRKAQLSLAKELNVKGYSCPGGGCLLTCEEFVAKLKDLFEHKRRVSMKDLQLLKIGRHFRSGNNKIIVGRNEHENRILLQVKEKSDFTFEAQNTGSPLALLQGPKTQAAIETAADLTAYHCDIKQGFVTVKYGKQEQNRSIKALVPSRETVDKFRLRAGK